MQRVIFSYFRGLSARAGPAGSCHAGNHFPTPTTSISNGDEIGLQHEGRSLGHAINDGVGAVTFILRFIYREYCRSCFLHIRYL
jgi:hypothetical protein